MNISTLETIHNLLKTNVKSTEKALELVQKSYYDAQTLADEAEGEAADELRKTAAAKKRFYESIRKETSLAQNALEDFEQHEFN